MAPAMKSVLSVLALLAFSAGWAGAQDAPAAKAGAGSVVGTILDKDGKPAAGVKVRLFAPYERGGKRGNKSAATQPTLADAAAAPATGNEKAEKPNPAATATSDAEGKFMVANLPAGEYVVVARLRGQGGGRQQIEVNAGEEFKVELKLDVKPEKAGKKAEKAPAQ